jgi:hypothetical protein
VAAGAAMTVAPRIEHQFRAELRKPEHNLPTPASFDELLFSGRACEDGKSLSQRRPDILWLDACLAIIGEVDEEGGHPRNEAQCEASRMWDIAAALKCLMGEETVVVFIRVNPHGDGKRRPGVPLAERARVMAQRVNAWAAAGRRVPWELPYVEYHYYSQSCIKKHVDFVLTHPGTPSVCRVTDVDGKPVARTGVQDADALLAAAGSLPAAATAAAAAGASAAAATDPGVRAAKRTRITH